ncbi:MAG: BMP family ABC transporter substrate-binding protein [Eubacteriales bacterium]
MKEKKKFRMIKLIVAVLIMTLTVTGCSLPGNQDQEDDRLKDGVSVGMLTDDRGIEDPYFEIAWEGFSKAKEDLGTEITYLEAKKESQYPSKLKELYNQGCDVIFTWGQDIVPAVLEAADSNQNIKYVCVDAYLEEPVPSNVLGVSYKVEEGAFLAGYIAGKKTKSYVVGYIAGEYSDLVERNYYGYKTGIKKSNSTCEVMKGLAATFTNKTRVQEMAEYMYDNKADIIFHAAGTAGKGLMKAAVQADKMAIGSDVDQNYLAPDNVITSVVKRHDNVVYDIISQYKNLKLETGKNIYVGMAESAIDIAELTSESLKELEYSQVMKFKEEIIQGDLVIPYDEGSYLEFVKN